MTLTNRRFAVAVASLALIALVGSGCSKSGGGSENGCVVNANGNGTTVNCGGAPPVAIASDAPNADDAEVAKQIRRDSAPMGSGPWAFSVLFDNKIGLFVRNNPEQSGYHLGYAAHGAILYVDCVKDSSFDPEPGQGFGPHWYRVHWPNSTKSEELYASNPSDPPQGWAWAFYMRPNGTNGNVPKC